MDFHSVSSIGREVIFIHFMYLLLADKKEMEKGNEFFMHKQLVTIQMKKVRFRLSFIVSPSLLRFFSISEF